MTWTAHATVTAITPADTGLVITAEARADTTRRVRHLTGYEDGDMHGGDQSRPTYAEVDLPAIVSNTEGDLTKIEVRLHVAAQETQLKPGDEIYLSGHFIGVALAENAPAADASAEAL